MPSTITDPFGNVMEVCSISTKLKAELPKLSFLSEAQWMADIKKAAFYTLRQKIQNVEIPKNTVVARAQDSNGVWKMVYKGGDELEVTYPSKVKASFELSEFENYGLFDDVDWDFGPNMAQMAKQAQAVVDSPAKLAKWLNDDPEALDLDLGDLVAEATSKKTGQKFDILFDGMENGKPRYKWKSATTKTETQINHSDFESIASGDYYEVEYKVGQTPPLPAAAKLPPVSSTSKSTGLLTNEEAATMFVKTKDELAKQAGINIKGASGKLDELVYKTIADQAGYTPAEMLAKVEAYKGTGKKLSALKKKVLPKDGNPKQTPTQISVNKSAEAVKKEEIKPEEVVMVWDDEAVAKAYIKAKDHVVANNDKGWTLYTKSPDLDNAILKKMQEELGPIKQDVANTAVANYIANNKKLSVLKKQMIKSGEMKAEADTLKKPKSKFDGDDEAEDATDPKPAPDTTDSGVGKASEDPTKIGPKQTLTEAQEEEIFKYWEGANMPLSMHGQSLYSTALSLAKQYDLGDDVLPILRAVDKGKTKKFNAPENKMMYEKKVLEHLANPTPSGYVPPSSSSFGGGYLGNAPKVFGEIPEDSSLFREISYTEMEDLAKKSMRPPTMEERAALNAYSSSSKPGNYHEINEPLRFGGSVHRNVQALQDSMVPIPDNIVIRRGTNLKGVGVTSHEELAASVGKTFTEPAFSSAAVGGGEFSNEVRLIIQTPKGALGRWLRPYSEFQTENELLLAKGTRFKILKVEQSGGHSSTVHVRVET